VSELPRLGRWFALAAWTMSLALPAIGHPRTTVAGPAALAHDICTSGGGRMLPPGNPEPDKASECPCCAGCGASAPPARALGRVPALTPPDDHTTALAAPRAASVTQLPPSRGPPLSALLIA
jgi:hypothetical protein